MTEIRFAHENEKDSLKALWKECFFDSDEYINFWFDTVFRPERAVVAANGGEIEGALHLIPYTLTHFGKNYSVFYIYAFGISPFKRGRGIGSRMLDFTHSFCKGKNTDFMMLISDADGYYERFGYTLCAETVQYKISLKDISAVSDMQVRKASSSDALAAKYRRFAEKFDIHLSRDADALFREYTDKIIESDGGYAVYSFENENIHVYEAAYDNTDTLLGFLSFFKGYKNQKSGLILSASPHDPIKRLLYGKNVKKYRGREIMAKSLCGENPEKIFGFDGKSTSLINIF